MKPFLITVVGGLLCVASLIFWADPPGRWHCPPAFPNRELRPGEVWVFPTNYDTRAERFNHIHWMAKPDVIFYGSSRVLKVGSAMINARFRMCNLGILYPTVTDYVIFWETLVQERKTPSYLIIFIDPWVLNAHNSFGPQAPPRRPRAQASASIAMRFIMRGAYIGRYAFYWISQLGEFFRATELIDALHHARTGYPPARPPSAWIIPENTMTTSMHGLRWDGSMSNFPPAVPVEDLRAYVRKWYSARKHSPFLTWERSEESQKQLDAFLKTVTRAGTHVMIVLPPYQPVVYGYFQNNNAERQKMNEYAQAVSQTALQTRDVALCDAENPAIPGCGETEFQDEHHMRESCVEKLLSYCLTPLSWRTLRPAGDRRK